MPKTISEVLFRELMGKRGRKIVRLARMLNGYSDPSGALTRPLLGEFLSQASQLEELLDMYGAKNNRNWSRFRSLIAAIKLFADVAYELVHIQHQIPSYRLLPIEGDFQQATQNAKAFVSGILCQAAGSIVAEAERLRLAVSGETDPGEHYVEELPHGHLPMDQAARQIETVAKTVSLLATSFLNLAAESRLLHVSNPKGDRPERYSTFIPDPISEKNLRDLEYRFHNLQSLYDTYVSESITEDYDADLPVLRGHISVIFHLLKTGTMLAHYFERHVNVPEGASEEGGEPIVDPDQLLEQLMNYSIHFARDYLAAAQRLCQSMLRRYTEVGRIEVNVPRYRGFHVRPATMVSKIVQHYGSQVQKELEGEAYDASTPLDIFRINEKINAGKRHRLVEEIVTLRLVPESREMQSVVGIVRGAVLRLAEQGKLIVYEQPLQLNEECEFRNESLLELVTSEITRLQATGKIDITSDLKVAFVGDKRVLEDIALLAESGYGEDDFGNNIPLPDRLRYLRQ